MVKIRQTFIESYLNNKLLDAVKLLNQVIDVLDPVFEHEKIAQIENIKKLISRIEI